MAKVEKEKKEKKHFFKDFKAELKKVIWPTPKQVVNNTTAVITIVLITALIVFVLDLAFETLNTHGVDRLKSIVSKEEANVLDDTVIDDATDSDTIVDDTIIDDTADSDAIDTDTTEENTVSET